jgi:hypothetical protein
LRQWEYPMTMSDPPHESPQVRPGPLVPVAEHRIPFHGDMIAAALVPGDAEPVIVVPLRPFCDRLGLDWAAQLKRIKRDPVLAGAVRSVVITTTEGGPRRTAVCLPADMLHGWLFGVSAQRINPEYREALNTYRRECFAVLWRAYQAGELGAPSQRPEPTAGAERSSLIHVRATALAVAALAEQQMAIETRVGNTEDRLDRAAEVVWSLTRRLTALESVTGTIVVVNEAQAAEIGQAVKALAQHIAERQPAAIRPYATVFGELYRRFGVTSYKNIPAGRLSDVLAFLEDWRVAILAGKEFIT